MYMGAGVRHLVLCGTLSIVLRPSSQPPFFGGLEVFFLNTPKLNLDFTGLAKVADFPGVSSVIRSTIMDVVNQSMVLPARIMYDVEDPDAQGIADQQFLEPLGILRITVRSAQNLPVSVSFTGQKKIFRAICCRGSRAGLLDFPKGCKGDFSNLGPKQCHGCLHL